MATTFKVSKRTPRHIEIFVDGIEQLFNSMDPSPFHEKDLDHDAEEFITSWAREFTPNDPLVLIVHLNHPVASPNSAEAVEKAVRHYFSYRAKLNQLEFKRLLKEGRKSLLIGLIFLGICLLVSQSALHMPDGTLQRLIRESLAIAGWVAMWRPMQTFLYDWWPLRRLGRIYQNLSRMPVELRTAGHRS